MTQEKKEEPTVNEGGASADRKPSVLVAATAFFKAFNEVFDAFFTWLGGTFRELAPVVIKWSAITVIAGFAALAVAFVSIEDDADLVFGIMDRVEAVREAEREHLLDAVSVAKGYAEAEFGPGATLRSCQTVDFNYIWFE